MKTLKSLVDQMVVTAPVATQVYQIDIEQGEVVAPGIPLLSLVDMNDIWLGFDLREDLIKGAQARATRSRSAIPALGDREVRARSGSSPPRANMPAGGRRGRPAISISAPSPSAPIR